jgi:hypothetical protein
MGVTQEMELLSALNYLSAEVLSSLSRQWVILFKWSLKKISQVFVLDVRKNNVAVEVKIYSLNSKRTHALSSWYNSDCINYSGILRRWRKKIKLFSFLEELNLFLFKKNFDNKFLWCLDLHCLKDHFTDLISGHAV